MVVITAITPPSRVATESPRIVIQHICPIDILSNTNKVAMDIREIISTRIQPLAKYIPWCTTHLEDILIVKEDNGIVASDDGRISQTSYLIGQTPQFDSWSEEEGSC